MSDRTSLDVLGLAICGLLKHRRRQIAAACLIAAGAVGSASAQTTTLLGSALTMKSASSTTLGTTGYVGTYVVIPSGGATINFSVNATEAAAGSGGAPHMQLVVADTTASFNVASTSATNYTTGDMFLPAGTYVVRDERDYGGNTTNTHSFTVGSISVNTVSGGTATFSNTNTGTVALAAADSYIQNFRQGTNSVTVTGPGGVPLLAGTQVNAHMARIGFDFGNAVPGTSPNGVNTYLGSNGTTQQTTYQKILNQDFNAIVPENMGKWSSDEANQGGTSNMTGIDTMLNYASAHNMDVRMHNLIWGGQQPGFVTTALNTGTLGAGTLNADINSRINYYVGTGVAGDRANKYTQLDVYNESYHTGETQTNSYWKDMGVGSIAAIYNKVHTVAPNVKLYVNEYNVYEDGGDNFAKWYQTHLEEIRNAGVTAGFGTAIIGGIGTQYYPNDPNVHASTSADPAGGVDGSAHDPARVMETLQNLSTEGVPITLTEFGVKAPGATGAGAVKMDNGSLTAANSELKASQILSDSMRLMFGNANATGFMMWGFQAEGTFGATGTFASGSTFGTNLFQSESALYKVVTSGANAWGQGSNSLQITSSGKVWEGLLGVGTGNYTVVGSDGKTLSPWSTPDQMYSVDANGNISLTGFYGDYNIGSQTANSDLSYKSGSNIASLVAPPTWSLWNTANSGSWTTAGNWSTGGVANATGQTAYFGPTTPSRTVTVDTARTVGMLALDSGSLAGSYTIGGAGTITLQGFNTAGGHVAAIYVAAGSHQIDAPLVMSDNTTMTIAPTNSTLTLTNFQSSIATLTKAGAGTVAVNTLQAGGLQINAGTVKLLSAANGGTSSAVNGLGIASLSGNFLGTLNTTDQSVTVNYTGGSPLGTIQTMLKSGYANGSWNGTGINSSSAATMAAGPVTTAIGYAEASDLGVGTNAVILEYVMAGDANMDGVVNALDFNAVAASYGSTSSAWLSGDFTYDGVVNTSDFALMANNFGQQLPVSAPFLGALVPEPAMMGAVVLCGLIGRRRRQ